MTSEQASGAPPGRGALVAALAGVNVAGLVVFVLAVSGVFSPSGNQTSTDNPQAVVEKLMRASVEQDLAAVKRVVCSQDLANSELAKIVSDDDHVTRYTVTSVELRSDEQAEVTVDLATPDDTDTTATTIPVVKEDGAWKACLSRIGQSGGTDGPTATGTGADTGCASSESARETATQFISYITIGNADRAHDCVYDDRISVAQLEALTGADKAYSPTLDADQDGPDFEIMSGDGEHTLRFTVEQQSDGRYYVVSASDS